MFAVDDTIVAIATPMGRGGIGVVRLSGPDAATIACRLIGRREPFIPRYATFATIAEPGSPSAASGAESRPFTSPPAASLVRDEVVVTHFPQPHSYTGEDVVEVSAHGSPVVLRGLLQGAIGLGARLAEPGEFTLRRVLNGKADLIQAEAVADLIDAVTPLQARAAFDQLEGTLTARIGAIEAALFDLMARLEASLDFPDEGYHFVGAGGAAAEIEASRAAIDALLAHAARGRLIREGAQIAIVGSPNVGKSSLFNTLLNADRAIVSPTPGTTRDLLTERADIRGIAVALVDTAGIRDSADQIEQEGVVRAQAAARVADLTVLVLDRSRPLDAHDRALLDAVPAGGRLVVANKIDLPAAWSVEDVTDTAGEGMVAVSVRSGSGVDALVDRMAGALGVRGETRDEAVVSNVRHIALLERARAALGRAGEAVQPGAPVSEEFVLADLQDAAAALQEVTGRRSSEDLLAHIFARFCIGK